MILLTFVGSISCPSQTIFRELSLDKAFELARKERKLVFVDFYTDWCGPCKMMLKHIFPLEETGNYMNSHFVCLKMNAEKEGAEHNARFNINHYPTFIILSADNQLVARHEGGFSESEKFINTMESLVNPYFSPRNMEERYAKGERTPQLIAAFANMLVTTGNDKHNPQKELTRRGIDIVNDYFLSLTTEQRCLEENSFLYDYLYMTDAEDPKILFVNHKKEQLKDTPLYDKMKSAVNTYYQLTVKDYLSCRTPLSKENYLKMKNDINRYSFNSEHQYDLLFQLIDVFYTHNMRKYIRTCKNNIWRLSEEDRRELLSNYHHIIGHEPHNLKRAARFMRGLLQEASVSTIIYMLRPMEEIEKRLNSSH